MKAEYVETGLSNYHMVYNILKTKFENTNLLLFQKVGY